MLLLRECHGVLMSGVRGAEKTPGELRQSQNWIGAASATVADAAFVPPPPEILGPTLQAWETYIHDPEPRLPLLIRSALLHYQFETIHPFLDGNGRLGRVFVVLHLLQEQRITAPLLYLSAHLEQNRTTYYERLQAVRERGEIQEWLQFFLQPSPPRQSTPSPGRTILSTCVRSSVPDFAASAAAPRRWSTCCSATPS